MTPGYPFSALVGQDQLRLALVLCAVRPEIGGVLIRGEKGTAKSTAVRGLARVLSAVDADSALVELPIGATEDRVVGSLDLQRVLRDGEHAFSPGLLARAHGGVLYVDEVNLLHDHLVDVLLDAAAMGRVHIERDGVSHSHDARFVLIGTMNPEEGELRPQLLDRFGLTVDVRASRDVDVRVDVIRARLAFEADQAGFAAALRRAGRRAGPPHRRRPQIRQRCRVAGQRITPHRRAVRGIRRRRDARRPRGGAHRCRACGLAWIQTVDESDIRVAAELALPHRRRRDPFDDPGLDPEQLDDAMASTQEQTGEPRARTRAGPAERRRHIGVRFGLRAAARQFFADNQAERGSVWSLSNADAGGAGRGRGRSRSTVARAQPHRDGGVVDVGTRRGPRCARLRDTARLRAPTRRPGRPRPQADDVRRAIREGREGNLVIFVVDASGSMAARDRMAAVSGATLSLLRDAYQRRDKVAVITFRGQDATVLLPPTSSVHIAGRRLARFDTGGKTPLAQGLLAARDVVVREKARDRARRCLVVVLTDGRATGGADPLGRMRIAAARLVAEGAAAVVVDCETSFVRLGLAEELARHLDAPAVRLSQLRADSLTAVVRTAA